MMSNNLNIKILYLDKMSSWGTLEIRPAKTAPDPMVTKRAGKAQQIKVPKLVNKLMFTLVYIYRRLEITQ